MMKLEEVAGRTWTAMVASLPTCFGCRLLLRNAAATVDSFCRDCIDRSRPVDGDDLGGES